MISTNTYGILSVRKHGWLFAFVWVNSFGIRLLSEKKFVSL